MKFETETTTYVTVVLDETKFTPEFMEEFRQGFYKFNSLKDHAMHLASLYATGRVDSFTAFIEGYGYTHEMGIEFNEEYTYTDGHEVVEGRDARTD